MEKLNRAAPRRLSHFAIPSYPRALGIGALLLAGACGKGSDPATAGGVDAAVDTGRVVALAGGAVAPPIVDAVDAGEGSATNVSVDAGVAADAAEAGRSNGSTAGPTRPPPRPAGGKPSPFHSAN